MQFSSTAVMCVFSALILGCGGGGGSSSQNPLSSGNGFTVRLGMTEAAGKTVAAHMMGSHSSAAAITPSNVEFTMAMAGNQGVLYASANGADDAALFNVNTTINGVKVGSGAGSESFLASDPSLCEYTGSGGAIIDLPSSDRPIGVFMARFTPAGSTDIAVTPAGPLSLSKVDELVMRIGAPYYMMYDQNDLAGPQKGVLIAAPHYRYNPGAGLKMYSDVTDYSYASVGGHRREANLQVNSKPAFANLEYIFFIPRTLPGLVNSFSSGFVFGPDPSAPGSDSFTVPVIDASNPESALKPNSKYEAGNWCYEAGNAGLNAVIDRMVGTTDLLGRTTEPWLAMSRYLQQYILKFNKVGCIPWNAAGVIGNVSGLSAEIIVLEAPLTLSANSTLNLTYDATQSSYAYDTDTEMFSLSGNPPVHFVTSVQ